MWGWWVPGAPWCSRGCGSDANRVHAPLPWPMSLPPQVVYQIPKKPYAGGEDPELRLHVVFYFARLTPPGYVETEVGWCAWWW